jgi:hypothetical protein
MTNIKVNAQAILLLIVGIIMGSRLEILSQQNSWTPAICVAQVVEGDDLVFVEENGNSKSVKPSGKRNAVAVR